VAAKQPLQEAHASRWLLRPLLSALAFLHQGDLLHRGVQLENTLMDGQGRVRLADFGLAIDR
jgi:serine/threonine protein kinase